MKMCIEVSPPGFKPRYIDGGDNPKLEADLLSATYLDEWDPKFPAALREIVRRRAPHAAAAGLWADETASAWGSCGGYSPSNGGPSKRSCVSVSAGFRSF